MFRKKADRFVFTKAGEKITADTVLAYLGKSIPVCPYSGDTINVVKFPVDFNAQNILPSNMDYVSKTLLQKKDGDLIMITVECDPFTVTLYGPTFVLDKHVNLLKEVIDITDHEKEIIKTNPVEAIYAMWDALMYKSIKGLFEIKLKSGDLVYIAEAQLAIGKLVSKMKEREELVSPKFI